MDKADFLRWSRKYDRTAGNWLQREQELGARFRRAKALTCADLAAVAEWKLHDASPEKLKRVLEAVTKNDEATVARISSQVFNVPAGEDAYRVNSLITLNGVSPVLASVVLTFFCPRDYGVFDVDVWRALLGNEPPNVYSPENYVRLLASLRKTSAKHNLDVRTVEKALFQKSREEKT